MSILSNVLQTDRLIIIISFEMASFSFCCAIKEYTLVEKKPVCRVMQQSINITVNVE